MQISDPKSTLKLVKLNLAGKSGYCVRISLQSELVQTVAKRIARLTFATAEFKETDADIGGGSSFILLATTALPAHHL